MLEHSQAARGGGTVHEVEGHLWCKQIVGSRRKGIYGVNSLYAVRDTARGVFRVPPSSPPAIRIVGAG